MVGRKQEEVGGSSVAQHGCMTWDSKLKDASAATFGGVFTH